MGIDPFPNLLLCGEYLSFCTLLSNSCGKHGFSRKIVSLTARIYGEIQGGVQKRRCSPIVRNWPPFPMGQPWFSVKLWFDPFN